MLVVAEATKQDLILQPQSSFETKKDKTGKNIPTFLAGEALIITEKKNKVRFVYGQILFHQKSMVLLAKENDRFSIQNLNEEIEIELNYGSKVRLSPFFEMILRRDLSSREGFVIEQLRPLDLKSHLLKFQRITKVRPPVLISYGRRLKNKIEIAKQQYAEASQESASRKPAAIESGEDLQKHKKRLPTKRPKTLRERFEEKALGHTL